MRVYEDLKYKKHYIGDNRLSQIFQLGLFVDNGELDKELHEQTYLFRENLKIRPSEPPYRRPISFISFQIKCL